MLSQVGDPTIIVNNAGVVQGKTILELNSQDVLQYVITKLQVALSSTIITRTFGVNTMAHFWLLKAFLPGLLKAGTGHIVTPRLYLSSTLVRLTHLQITMSSVMAFAGAARMSEFPGRLDLFAS